MTKHAKIVSVLLSVALVAGVAGAADEARIGELVKQLGADDYRSREQAQKELTEIGPPAIPFLEEVLAETSDPEVKLRAGQILPEVRRQAAKLLGERIKENVLWKTPLKAAPAGELVAAQGVILVGSAGRISAVDTATGKILWRCLAKTGMPAMADDATVYFVGSLRKLRARNLKKKEAGDRPVFEAGKVIGAPVLADGVIYAGISDGALYAVDTRTGQSKWKCPVGEKKGLGPAPAVGAKAIYVPVGRAGVAAVDRTTGKMLWKTSLGGLHLNALAVCGDKLIAQIDGQAYALDAGSGKVLWRISVGQGPANMLMMGRVVVNGRLVKVIGPAGAGQPGIAVRGDTAYIAGSGLVVAIDVNTGRRKWSVQPKADGDKAGSADEAGANGGWVQDFGGAAQGGMQIRMFNGKVQVMGAGGRAGLTAPLAAGEVVYVGSGKGLIALDGKTGEQLWVLPTTEAVMGRPVMAGGVIYFATSGGTVGSHHLYAVRLKEAK